MMDIFILSMEFPPGPGGMGNLTYQAAIHFSKLGWNVRVAAPQRHINPTQINKFNLQQPFRIISFRQRGPLIIEAIERFILVLFSVIGGKKPEMILTLGWQVAVLGKIISLITNIPLVALGIGSEFLLSGIWGRATKWAFEKSKHIVFISQYVRNLALEQDYMVTDHSVILLGADHKVFKPGLDTLGLKKRYGIFGNQTILLSVGQVSKRKAQDIVIQALPRIIKQIPEILYFIVGLPTEQATYQALANELGVEKHVIFTGIVSASELPFFYNLADIFLMISRQTQEGSVEGFGIAAIEAQLCGKPSIVSANTGLVEAVIPDETALVIEPDDSISLAEGVITLISDKRLYRKMSRAALEHSKRFTWETQMNSLAKTLYKVVEY